MPRARSNESEDVVVAKKPRAPRARVVLADGVPAPRKRAPRTVTPPLTAPPVSERESEAAPVRKAPTLIGVEQKRSSRRSIAFYIVSTFCVLLVLAGVVVGLFDHGQIDVATLVTIRNEKIARGEVRDENGQPITTAVPVQVDNRPNGGLTKADPALIPAPTTPAPVANATTTATSSEIGTSTATTTTTSTATTSVSEVKSQP